MATSSGYNVQIDACPYLGDSLITITVTDPATGLVALTTCDADDIVEKSEELDARMRNAQLTT